MKEILYIYHHLGLGDHVVCNGIVRHYAALYKRVFLFVKPIYIKQVTFMYRDANNVKLIAMDDMDVKNFIRFNTFNEYLIVGHRSINADEKFDKVFYDMAKLPLEDKWEKFHVERDIEKEKHVYYNVLGLKDDEEFIFVQDKPQFPINISHRKIIKSEMRIDFFDYIFTLERAKEIHCLNSSFNVLIDCLQIKGPRLFLYNTSILSNLRLPWNIQNI